MDEKETVLIRVSYLIELPKDYINSDDGMLDRITNELSENKKLHLDDFDITLEWNCTSSITLESENINCGKCAKCRQWTN